MEVQTHVNSKFRTPDQNEKSIINQNESENNDESLLNKRKRENNLKVTTKNTTMNNKIISSSDEPKRSKDPNLRELPEAVMSLVEKGSLEYVVTGDGPCLLRTTAAHTEGGEEGGPQLGRDLNTHQGMYRDEYIEKIRHLFPLEITIGVNGESKRFDIGQEQDYFNWLVSSKKSAFMWRGCLDLLGTANMAKMDIDVIVHENGSEPEVIHFSPIENFPWNEFDPQKPNYPNERRHGKMTVLNWKNLHFNLIVSPSHMLYQHGSMEFQENNSKQLKEHINQSKVKPKHDDKHTDCKAKIRDQDNEIRFLKKSLNQLSSEVNYLRKSNKPRENEKSDYNVEKSSNSKQDENYDENDFEEMDGEVQLIPKNGFHRTNPQTQPEPFFKCDKCDEVYESEAKLKFHMTTHGPPKCNVCCKTFVSKVELVKHNAKIHPEEKSQFHCDDCLLNFHTGPQLRKHMNTNHHKPSVTTNENEIGETLNCKICSEEFSEWWNLMHHRRDVHPMKRKKCRNYMKGECSFEDDECWWRHANTFETSIDYQNDKCSICSKKFSSTHTMMIHKKLDHESQTPFCAKNRTGHCTFQNCWFRHKLTNNQFTVSDSTEEHNEKQSDHDTTKEITNPWGFQKSQMGTKPPESAVKNVPELEDLREMVQRAMNIIVMVDSKLKTVNN